MIKNFCNNFKNWFFFIKGYGKTIQTISFLGYLKSVLKIHEPHLIVTHTASSAASWEFKIKTFCPILTVVSSYPRREEAQPVCVNFSIF